MTPINKKYIGAILISMGLFGLIAFAWPTYSNIFIIKTGTEKISQDRDAAKAALENIIKIKEDYNSKGSEVAKITKLIPPKKNTEEIISTIETIIPAAGLRMSRLVVGNPKSQADSPYNLSTIEMTLSGAYPSLAILLRTIENNIRLLDVVAIRIGKDQQSPGQLNFGININGYYLKSDASTINK